MNSFKFRIYNTLLSSDWLGMAFFLRCLWRSSDRSSMHDNAKFVQNWHIKHQWIRIKPIHTCTLISGLRDRQCSKTNFVWLAVDWMQTWMCNFFFANSVKTNDISYFKWKLKENNYQNMIKNTSKLIYDICVPSCTVVVTVLFDAFQTVHKSSFSK